MSIKKIDGLAPVTTREIARLNRDIQFNTMDSEAKQREVATIRAIEEAQDSNMKAAQVRDKEVDDWRTVHNPSESEKYPLARKIDPEVIAINKMADKVEDAKDWRIVSEPNEDKEHPLIKDGPAQTALKKLNII